MKQQLIEQAPEQSEPSNLDEEACWQDVLNRNGRADGTFVYGVCSTLIFCRPSCPSRRPNREQARFFALPEAAMQAGFRPCKRCRPEQFLSVQVTSTLR